MKLWTLATFCAVSLLLFSGCALKPTPNAKAVVDSSLPVVTLTENGVVVDMKAIAFEWQSIKDTRVKGIYVYKQTMTKGSSEQEYYETINNRFATHYADDKIAPNTQYSYYFKTFSDDAESMKSNVSIVNSLPVLESVSWIHSVENMPRSVKVIWRPHVNQIVKSYIVERRTLDDERWTKVATIEGRFNAEYIDTKLDDSCVYKYRIRVLTYDGIISEPSEIVTAVTKALPNEIKDITASANLPKKIKVSWGRVETKDFASYNVYRSSKLDGSYTLVTNIRENSYADSVEEDGKSYFYRVSMVDVDGLESNNEKQSVQGYTLSKPTAPSISEAKIIDNQVVINWRSIDSRVKNYIVTKKTKKSWFNVVNEEFTDVNSDSFVDSAIEPETTYIYQVYGVDEFSVKSEPSIEVLFTTTKSQGKIISPKEKKQNSTKSPKRNNSNNNSSSDSAPDNSNTHDVVKPIEMIEI
jgi:fibronectin type 3 domain-containing protein